jgi:hypothetical protein
MLQNAYFLAKIAADTAENEQHFAENLPKKLATTLRVQKRVTLRTTTRTPTRRVLQLEKWKAQKPSNHVVEAKLVSHRRK